ncbi:YtxH domain-containing protein [Camelliibacillus cellulosilyticus]|uniref:YtxH domain-containing protein n=1 Tax=Camelliibacillus cellulosilyticus TaxID=2174486 RepID=A0ABV9GMA2_9BACL
MSEDNGINKKDFFLGAFVGGVVGAVAALLFAPKSGKEIRSDISEQSQNLVKKGGDFAQLAKEKSSNLARTVSDQSIEVMGKVKELPNVILRNGKNSQTAVGGADVGDNEDDE